MKVAYVTMQFPASSETFATTDVRQLRESGVEVSVYTLRASRQDAVDLLRERQLSGLRVTQPTLATDVKGLAGCLARPVVVLRLLLWLLRRAWRQPIQLLVSVALVPRSIAILTALERDQPDVVHLFWGHYPCIVGYLVLTQLPRCVVSLFLGAYDLHRAYAGTAGVAVRADLVWTHATLNVPTIRDLGVEPERIHVAYRGIDLTRFASRSETKKRCRIVVAARLIPEKRVDDALRVFRDVHRRWPEATLRVLGDGPERSRLQALTERQGVTDAVTFAGHRAERDVATEMAEAEVFLLMSTKESERLPNVVKEAMASRCLCVVTDTPGIDELMTDGQHGFIVPQRDVRAAVARIDEVFSGRVDVGSILDAAADRVRHRFDVSKSMSAYRAQWQHAIRARQSCPGADALGPAVTTSPHAGGAPTQEFL